MQNYPYPQKQTKTYLSLAFLPLPSAMILSKLIRLHTRYSPRFCGSGDSMRVLLLKMSSNDILFLIEEASASYQSQKWYVFPLRVLRHTLLYSPSFRYLMPHTMYSGQFQQLRTRFGGQTSRMDSFTIVNTPSQNTFRAADICFFDAGIPQEDAENAMVRGLSSTDLCQVAPTVEGIHLLENHEFWMNSSIIGRS